MYAKAIAALITPLIVSLLMPLGIDETTSVGSAIEMIILALSTAAMVYFVPNKLK